jgi:hypothetical protein
MKKFLTGLFLLVLATTAQSQITYFSQDTAVFVKQFDKYMSDAKNENTLDEKRKFKNTWNDNKYDETTMRSIIKNMNRLIIQGNSTPDDQFYQYIRMLNFFQKKNTPDLFAKWHKYFDQMIMMDMENYQKFMGFSQDFFIDKCLTQTEIRKWKTNSPDYEFTYNKFPVIKFKNTDLGCYTEGDTIFIQATSGTYLPYTKQWTGLNGKITWARCGYDTDKVYAKFKTYAINMGRGDFKIDTVSYYNLQFFSKPLQGSFEEKVSVASSGEKSTYPRFLSFDKDITIKNLVKDVDITGGFWHKGGKVLANGNDSIRTRLVFKYKGNIEVIARANTFAIDDTRLVSDKAEVSYYMRDSTGKTDSIYHPQVALNFPFFEKTLSAVRNKEGISKTPFMDSYHKLEINCDLLNWQTDLPIFELKMINPDAPAVFESKSYYRENRYESVQGLLDYNPVERMRFFCLQRAKEKFEKPGDFTLQEYCDHVKNKKDYVLAQILMLNDRGFLIFDPNTEKISVQKKTFDYWNNHMNLSDFDVMRLESIIKLRPNGTINLINNDLAIEGCPGIQFSDSQSVFTIATEQKLVVKKNRDMTFGGKVHAGRFDFFGKDFYFNYEGFSIKMDNVDSMRFTCPSREDPEKYVLVQTVLQNIYGTLYIDKENNKSGRKDYPEYPRFVSDRGAMVYYDKPEIYNGIYNRNEFYFKTDPFEINSLDKFKLEDIKLSGLFSSGGIIPDIRDTLTVQKDYSLGFIRPTPPEGYPMFGGKGKNTGTISLSNEGFWGSGKLEYLSSVGNSQRYIMFLDSLNGRFEDYTITRTADVPDVKGEDIWLHWEPKLDRMFATYTTKPLDMMKGKADLFGTSILEPTGVGGYGDLKFDKAVLNSGDFKFHPLSVNAEVSNFQLYALKDTTLTAFQSNNINSFIDFDKRFGDFKANDLGANTFFPYNMYKTNMNDYHWEIDKKTLDFKIPSAYTPDDIYFESTKKEQDELRFRAGKANFDLNTNLLDIYEVPYINVVDAKVIPDKGNVKIEGEAYMRELVNSKVYCDSVSEFHKIYKCNMFVKGRFKMDGSGYYDYIQKGEKQVIYFDVVSDNKRGRAQAISHMTDSTNFLLGKKFQFKGEAKLYSTSIMLEFDGYIKPLHKLPIRTDWYRNTQYINPDSLILAFSHPINEYKVEVFSGVMMALDSPHVYPLFAGRKKLYADPELLAIHGAVYYDDIYQRFVIADSAKLKNRSNTGAYMTISEDKRKVFAEGKISLGLNVKDFVFNNAGEINIDLGDTPTTVFKVMTTIDFPLPKSALGLMQDSMVELNEKARNSNLLGGPYKRNVGEFLQDPKRVEKFFKKLNEDGKFSMEDEFEKMFNFSNLELEWHTKNKMYIANGEASLQNIGKKIIGKKIQVKIAIERKKSSDVVYLYVMNQKGGWYYFNFAKGVLGTISSDKNYNDAIEKDADKMKKINIRIRKATPRQVKTFTTNIEGWQVN